MYFSQRAELKYSTLTFPSSSLKKLISTINDLDLYDFPDFLQKNATTFIIHSTIIRKCNMNCDLKKLDLLFCYIDVYGTNEYTCSFMLLKYNVIQISCSFVNPVCSLTFLSTLCPKYNFLIV